MEAILSLDHIYYSYHDKNGEIPVINDLSFEIKPGSFTSIVGPSGCGKSTLLSLLCDLIKPEAGTIYIRPPENNHDSRMGYMLQKDNLFEWRNIYKNVMLGLEINNKKTPENIAYVNHLLEQYDLAGFKSARPSQLSGGMRQRAALIRTLALKPDILLLDEPFSALDYQTRLEVREDICSILRKEKKTVILVTHDISEAIAMTDRVLILTNRPAKLLKTVDIEARDKGGVKMNVSPLQRRFIIKQRIYSISVVLSRLILFLGFIGIWEFTADKGIINAFIFSSPVRLYQTFIDLSRDGVIFMHIWVTLYETLVAFAIITIVGIIFAILLWCFKGLSDCLEPFMVVLNSLPKSALPPMLIVWLGTNTKAIIITAVSVAIFGMIINLYTGFLEIDKEKITLIRTLGGKKWHILCKLILPGSKKIIISNMKVNIGLCLVGVIIGEFLAAKKGLGYLIIYGSQVFKMSYVVLGIVILCIISTLLFALINIIQKLFLKD